MDYSKHEFACIPTAAVHNNTRSVYKYELPWNTSSFCLQFVFSIWKQQKLMPESFDVSNYVIITAHVNETFT